MAIFEFSQKIRKRHFFPTPKTRLSTKKLANSNERIAKKNAKNLHFWAFWAKIANFGQFLAKMGKTGFFQKSAWNIFLTLTSPN